MRGMNTAKGVPWFLVPVAVLVPVGRQALAQPGDHIRFGNTEVRPAVVVGTEYNTNVYLAEKDPVAGVNIGASPSATLKTKSDKFVLGVGGAYYVKKFLDPNLANLDRFNNVSLDADASVLPGSRVGADFAENFYIASRPTEATSAEDALVTKINNDFKGLVSIHPGSALLVRVGGGFYVQDFRTPAEASVDLDPRLNTRVAFGPVLNANWKFFPRTSVVFQSSMETYNWGNNLVDISEEISGIESPNLIYGSYLAVPDGWDWRLTTGLSGRITQKVSVESLVGFGQQIVSVDSVSEYATTLGGVDPAELNATATGYGKNCTGADGVLASVKVKYETNPKDAKSSAKTGDRNHMFSVGYEKDFSESFFTNYIASSHVYTRYDGAFSQAFGATAVFGYRYEDYEGEITRQDHFFRLRGDLNYNVTKWSRISAGARWDQRASADKIHPDIEYDNVLVHGEVTFAY